jgi:uncharacterized protein (DUF736 family)
LSQYDNSNTFVLFLDEEKQSENHPDYTGSVELEDGRKLRLAAWRRVAGSGKKFLSGRVSEFQTKTEDSDF